MKKEAIKSCTTVTLKTHKPHSLANGILPTDPNLQHFLCKQRLRQFTGLHQTWRFLISQKTSATRDNQYMEKHHCILIYVQGVTDNTSTHCYNRKVVLPRIHGGGAVSFGTVRDFSQKLFPRSRQDNFHMPNPRSCNFSHDSQYNFKKTSITGLELMAFRSPNGALTLSAITPRIQISDICV